jgi:hypothetical protein
MKVYRIATGSKPQKNCGEDGVELIRGEAD